MLAASPMASRTPSRALVAAGSLGLGWCAALLPGCSRRSTPGLAVAIEATAPSIGAGTPCGDLDCAQYETPREAFVQALAAAVDPLVLGIGEVHAPAGALVPSAARRFTEDLLPTLDGRASDLLLELMMPPTGCTDAVAEVRQAQAPVTSAHAEGAQNEYLAMGEAARKLGIVPDMLRPTCSDMSAIERAGDGAIDVSLTTIARLTGAQAARLADRDEASDADRGKMVIVYGGALHNDLSPSSDDAARWSYAPALGAHVRGRFVAIDLVVPEFMGGGGSATWTSLPWWPAYDAAERSGHLQESKATLLRVGGVDARTFVLVFPGHPQVLVPGAAKGPP
jgi:hypothetical protein